MATTTSKTVTFGAVEWRRLEIITAHFAERNRKGPELFFDTGLSSIVRYTINKAFLAGVEAGLWSDLR